MAAPSWADRPCVQGVELKCSGLQRAGAARAKGEDSAGEKRKASVYWQRVSVIVAPVLPIPCLSLDKGGVVLGYVPLGRNQTGLQNWEGVGVVGEVQWDSVCFEAEMVHLGRRVDLACQGFSALEDTMEMSQTLEEKDEGNIH